MPLLREGTDAWVPVEAEEMRNGRYRVVGEAPEDQQWAFPSGSIVRCAQKAFSDGESDLVAVENSDEGETQMEFWSALDRFPFGDGPELADELLALILAGRKTATCWSAAEGPKGTEVGKQWVVEDGAGRPRAVLQTIELTQRRFDQVDPAFAADEGEGDRSLAYWRAAHQNYFTRNGGFSSDMLLWCERFRLVHIIRETAGR
jgi:uncharacterized protein YhfF